MKPGKSTHLFIAAAMACPAASCSRPTATPSVAPASNLPRVRVTLHKLEGGYTAHAAFADEAARKLEVALNSPELRRDIASGKYRHTDHQTSAQVLAAILAAKETSTLPGADNVIDLRLRTITRVEDGQQWLNWCEPGSQMGTIGIDGGGTGFVATCPQHLDDWAESGDHASLAGHMMHEYMHLLGYAHPRPGKRKSAVYRIGDLVEAAIRRAP